MEEADPEDISDDLRAETGDDQPYEGGSVPADIEVEIGSSGAASEPASDNPATANMAANNEPRGNQNTNPPIPSGRSVAHHDIVAEKAVYISFDIEVASPYVGVCQMSAEISRFQLNQEGTSKAKDTASNIRRENNTFNEL